METLSISEWVAMGVVATYVVGRILRLCGWDRGAYIADELRGALQDARGFMLAFRAGGDALNIDKAAVAVAAKVKGVDESDVRPIIEALAHGAVDNRCGVSISLNENGDVSVDPSGLTGKLVHKAGKWLKKVF